MVITLRGGGMGVSTCKTNDKQFLINVLNLQREYSQGNQIKTYLFERLKTENIAAVHQPDKRPNFQVWQMSINSAYHVDLSFTSSTLWEFVNARIMSSDF